MDNQDNVWIDRAEYERLKAQEAQTQSTPEIIGSGPATVIPGPSPTELSKTSFSRLTILTGIFAVISFIFPLFTLVFLGLGIASIVKYFRGRASRSAKVGVGIVVLIGVGLFVVIAGPFLLLIGFFIFWQIGCWTGLGSCTTA